jgi:hypothetical protein
MITMADWTLYQDNEEKTHRFYNITVKFLIKPVKHTRTLLSFTCLSILGEEDHNDIWHRYRVKGNIDYAKKIVDNTIIALDNIAIDCSDLDLCLKSFSLRKTSTHTTFPRWMRYITKFFSCHEKGE